MQAGAVSATAEALAQKIATEGQIPQPSYNFSNVS